MNPNKKSQLQKDWRRFGEYGLAKVSNPRQFRQSQIRNELAKVILASGESDRGVASGIYSYIPRQFASQIGEVFMNNKFLKEFWRNHLSLWLVKQMFVHYWNGDVAGLYESWILWWITVRYPGRRIK